MANIFGKIIFIAILMNCCAATFVSSVKATSVVPITEGNPNNVEDYSDFEHFITTQPLRNHPNCDIQRAEFFRFRKSLLALISQKLLSLEGKMRLLEIGVRINPANLSKDVQYLTEVAKLFSDLDLNLNLKNIRLSRDYDDLLTAEEYTRGLSEPVIKETSNSSTVEDIAAGIPDNYGLVVEIVNKLDSNLTDLELYLHAGLQHRRVSNIVRSNTATIFAFKQARDFLPHGVMKYRVGDTGFSFHLYFWTSKGRIAFGYLENSAPVKTVWPAYDKCSEYNHRFECFSCIDAYEPWSPNKTVTIHHGKDYAQQTGYEMKNTFISRVELFTLRT